MSLHFSILHHLFAPPPNLIGDVEKRGELSSGIVVLGEQLGVMPMKKDAWESGEP